MSAGTQRPQLVWLWQVLVSFAVLIGIVAALDEASSPRRREESSPPPASVAGVPYHDGSRRAFIFLIDSLALDAARNPELMPNLVALTARGASARLEASLDVVTKPAVLAAFTGRDNFRVLGFVEDFTESKPSGESLFGQLQRDGVTVVTYSDGSFLQFARQLTTRRPNAAEGERTGAIGIQVNSFHEAVDRYVDGEHDVVIHHVTFTDFIAHNYHPGSPEYVKYFGLADELVGRLMQEVPEADTLMVFGDHGHNAKGVHAVGMDVPSFVVLRGPAFRPGVDLGSIDMTDIRYLVGWALKVPLSPQFQGTPHPEALAGHVAEHPDYASIEATPAVPPRSRALLLILALYVGLLAALWLIDVQAPDATWIERLATLLSAVPLVAPVWLPWTWLAGMGIAAAFLVARWRTQRLTRRERWTVVACIAGALFFLGWGALLGTAQSHIPYVSAPTMVLVLLVGLALAIGVGRIVGPIAGSWVVFALVFVFAPPTTGPTGFASLFAQAWLCWAIGVYPGLTPVGAGPASRWDGLRRVLPVLGLFAFLQLFTSSSASNYVQEEWYNLTPFGVDSLGLWLVAGFFAKLVVFVRLGTRRRAQLAGLLVALGLSALEVFSRAFDPRWLLLGLAGAGVATLILRRRGAESDVVWLARLATLYLAFFYFIRSGAYTHMWLDCVLAALVLSRALLARCSRDEVVVSGMRFLTLVGLLGAGWAAVTWSVNGLEWQFLYDWIEPATVEFHAFFFAPFILARVAIPVVMVLGVLGELPRAPANRVFPAVRLIAGVKAWALMAVMCGLALSVPATGIYFEGVQHASTWILLAFALLMGARGLPLGRPDTAGASPS